jgi:pentatricopeptide repeat protein
MAGLCHVGKLKEAIKLFQQMNDSCHVPNSITYTTLMDGLCKEGVPEEAKKLLHEILKRV